MTFFLSQIPEQKIISTLIKTVSNLPGILDSVQKSLQSLLSKERGRAQSFDVLIELSNLIPQCYSKMNDRDILNTVVIMCSIITKMKTDQSCIIVDSITSGITKYINSPLVALQSLLELCNICATEQARLKAVVVFLRTAVSLKAVDVILPTIIGHWQEWIHLWHLDKVSARKLAFSIGNALLAAPRTVRNQHDILHAFTIGLSYLDLDPLLCTEIKPQATIAVSFFLASEYVLTGHILEIKALEILDDDLHVKSLFKIASLMVNGDLDRSKYETCAKAVRFQNADTSICLIQRAIYKSRLISLVRFCSNRSKVSYAELACALKISVCHVEHWIIQAINMKLLQARVRQDEEIIYLNQY